VVEANGELPSRFLQQLLESGVPRIPGKELAVIAPQGHVVQGLGVRESWGSGHGLLLARSTLFPGGGLVKDIRK